MFCSFKFNGKVRVMACQRHKKQTMFQIKENGQMEATNFIMGLILKAADFNENYLVTISGQYLLLVAKSAIIQSLEGSS